MFIGKLTFSLNLFCMNDKLDKCIQAVDAGGSEIPDVFMSYLVAAEDHRSSYHFGIDPIAMLRAFYVWLTTRNIEGASTIEQQFVRVVTSDYSRSFLRKFQEQLLAIAVSEKRNKSEIAKDYLAIAYYGYNCEGADGIVSAINSELKTASEAQIISIVARLKYPKPSDKLGQWTKIHLSRVFYIKNRHQKLSKLSKGWAFYTAA